MRTQMLASTLCFLLAACGGPEDPEEVYRDPAALTNQLCDTGNTVVIACPAGKVDGCTTGQTKVHKCVAENGLACALEVAIQCPAGYVDGCDTGESTVHRCVPKTTGPSCNLMLAILCPKGQVDGCVIGTTTVHKCVAAPPSCQLQLAILCPAGQVDGCSVGNKYHICVPKPQPCTTCGQVSGGSSGSN